MTDPAIHPEDALPEPLCHLPGHCRLAIVAHTAGAVQRALAARETEIRRLTASVNAANNQAEHFERGWYLRGDALESIKAHCQPQPSALAAAIVATCESALAAPQQAAPAEPTIDGYPLYSGLPPPAVKVEPLRRGVTGRCVKTSCECERAGLGDQCIWLDPIAAAPAGQAAASAERGWLVEWRFNGVQWLYLWPRVACGFSFTNDASKAIRFARREDAEAALTWVHETDSRRGTATTFGEMLVTEHEWAAPAGQAAAPHGWLYDWTHSSATGRPDERFTGFTTSEDDARRHPSHENVRAVYLQAPAAEAVQPLKPQPSGVRDWCTDPDNCRRCKAAPWDQPKHSHAGIPLGTQALHDPDAAPGELNAASSATTHAQQAEAVQPPASEQP